MGGAGLPLAPQVSELPLRFGLAQSSGPRSRGRPRDRGVTHSCTNPERASDGTGTAVAESLVTLSPSASINSLECKPRDDRWHDVSRHALNKAALQILLRYLRAFCDDDQVALVSLRSALAGSVADPDGLLGLIGGYLVDPETGGWRPLPQLRRLCREWGLSVPKNASWWPDLWAHTRLCLAEQDRPIGHSESWLAEQADGLFPAIAFPSLPVGEYPYWALRLAQSQQFKQTLSTGQRPGEPLAACAYDLTYDPVARAEFLDELDRFRARMSNAGRMARALDYGALIEFFSKMMRRPGCRADAAVLLFRALKAAVYHRAVVYLDRCGPEYRVLLQRLEIRLGATKEIPELTEAPALAVWLHVHDSWIEPVTSWAPLVHGLYRPSSWVDHLRVPSDVETAQARRLAVLFELAFADVAPDPGRGLSDLEAPLADLLPQALLQLLACDQEAGDQLIMANDILNELGSVEEDPTTAPWQLIRLTSRLARPDLQPQRRTAQHSSPNGAAVGTADLVDELRAWLNTRRNDRAPLWVTDADRVFDYAAALSASNDRDRHALMRRFTELLLAGARQDDRYPDEIQGMMDSLNPLVFSLASTGDEGLESMLAPTMRYLLLDSNRDPGPYASLLLRAITIVHSKHHRYTHAEQWLGTAWRWVRPSLNLEVGSAGFVKKREAAQQVALQASGMYMRMLEFRLADPAHRRATPSRADVTWRELRLLAKLGLGSAGFALNELTKIDEVFELPERRSRAQASSKAWLVNTRCMYMRGLLLQATLEAVEADRCGTGELYERWERERMQVFLNAVPLLYREATSRPLSQTYLNELTRIALHYAFLSGMKLLPPGAGPTPLPPHLKAPKAWPGPNGRVEYRFDVHRATQDLLDQGHDAGILASIAHPEVRAALARRSRPRPIRDSGVEDSPYQEWLETEERIDKLRRAIRLDRMPQGVGAVAAERWQMGQDWASWRWTM